MLIQCPECQKEVSDQAKACPHCGHPTKPRAASDVSKVKPSPGLLLMALALFITSGFSSGWKSILPAALAIAAAIASMVRNERGAGWGVPIITLSLFVGFFGLISPGWDRATSAATSDVAALNQTLSAVDATRIVSSRWVKDPDFTRSGAIKWFAEVENTSSRNIKSARVEFTTYDAAGNIVSKDSGFATAIPAGGRGSAKGYADFYRTEQTAIFRVTGASYAN